MQKLNVFFVSLQIFLFFLIVGIFQVNVACAEELDWETMKGTHFIVKYSDATPFSWAQKVMRRAEIYYDKVGDQIGYARYKDFWTWDERVIIYIYPDKETFVSATKFPVWVNGVTFRDQTGRFARQIISYQQESGFLDGVLPHEISHLILKDFMGADLSVALWFEEGVAQLQQDDRRALARQYMKTLVNNKQYMTLAQLMEFDLKHELDRAKVDLFYIQSVSVVDFLIKKYGSREFGELCKALRSGSNFNEALRTTYVTEIENINDLEREWIRYVQ